MANEKNHIEEENMKWKLEVQLSLEKTKKKS